MADVNKTLELSPNGLKYSSAPNADFSASATTFQPALETETTTEPEIPAVLSDIIIQRYEGSRSGELFHGEGVAYFIGGHLYKGNFMDGVMHGHGEYTWADGLKYKGDFKSNAPMGHGMYTWLDGSTYEGEVYNGIRHGTGTYKSVKTCTTYRGQWHKGKRHGKGTMFFNLEGTSWYEGDWENNQRKGWGMRCYQSGDTYEGQWKNNVRHGEGTMKWIKLGQQYSGQWYNGVQHGHGTQTWFLRRVSGSQYPMRNEYKGEFVQGLRHGQGTFFYASGAVYTGSWKDNKKHGQGMFIFKNGHEYDGEFIDDHMTEVPASSTSSLCALDGLPHRTEELDSASVLGPDLVLSIETLLNRIPEVRRRKELRQVEFAIMRHITILRTTYSVYSSLGHEKSQDNTFLLSQLQFWHFLKDCSIHQNGLTLAQLDHLINKDVSSGEVHSPSSTMLLRKWISCIVIAAYHIYHRDFESSSNVLAECFSKLMRHNIIPVKGPLYSHHLHAMIGKRYIDRCWDIYQTVPKVISTVISDIMTARHFVWMFKVLGLFDCALSTTRLLEILSLENPVIYSSTHSNLDLEIHFLEFFEALIGCAEVKNIHGVGTAQHRQYETPTRDQMKHSPFLSQLASPQQYESTVLSSSTIISSAVSLKSLEEFKSSATVQSSEELQHKEGTEERPEEQLENWITHIDQFFTHAFFPAYEHNLVCKKEMQKERRKQTTDNRITLEKAKANAKDQRRAEVERTKKKAEHSKEQMEEDEERSHALNDLNNSSTALTTPVTTSNSLDLKRSPNNKKKKK